MLQKRFRIKDASLFKKAFRSGKSFFFGDIACKATFLSGERARVGFSVSKNFFPRAVDRNAMKRLLAAATRESYRMIPDGWQIIFFLGRKTTPDKDGVRKSVSEIIRKISEIKK
jgi:ribonuclease P protein component